MIVNHPYPKDKYQDGLIENALDKGSAPKQARISRVFESIGKARNKVRVEFFNNTTHLGLPTSQNRVLSTFPFPTVPDHWCIQAHDIIKANCNKNVSTMLQTEQLLANVAVLQTFKARYGTQGSEPEHETETRKCLFALRDMTFRELFRYLEDDARNYMQEAGSKDKQRVRRAKLDVLKKSMEKEYVVDSNFFVHNCGCPQRHDQYRKAHDYLLSCLLGTNSQNKSLHTICLYDVSLAGFCLLHFLPSIFTSIHFSAVCEKYFQTMVNPHEEHILSVNAFQ